MKLYSLKVAVSNIPESELTQELEEIFSLNNFTAALMASGGKIHIEENEVPLVQECNANNAERFLLLLEPEIELEE